MNTRLDDILHVLQEKHYATYCTQYGEPGYTDPKKGIIFCDWNRIDKATMAFLEEEGYELEWSDEWAEHDGKAYRISPSSYDWRCQLIVADGEYIGPDDGADTAIEWCSHDRNHRHWQPLPPWVTEADLKEEGYELFQGDAENGWHPGQTDDPNDIADRAFKEGAERVVFVLTEQSQFYCRFECWILRG